MLSRPYRLRRRNDFTHLHKKGRVKHAKHFSIKYDQTSQELPRIAVVVSTKVSKKAVVRNRLRRRIYAQVRQILPSIKPSHDIMIMVKHTAIDASSNDLGQELVETLVSAGLLRTVSSDNEDYLKTLKKTKGAWAGDNWEETSKKREELELEKSRQRKSF
ncbi:MAG: ribonuclease P protein component [Candidatus Saccharimonadales bacterium]